MRSRIYYQKNNSLILQFIVNEYIAVCQLFKEWEVHAEKDDFPFLKKTFFKLIGPQGNLLTEAFSGGLIIKLQMSCQHFTVDDENSQTIHKLRKHVHKILELCWQQSKNIELKTTLDVNSHDQFNSKIQKYLKKMSRLIAKLIFQFGDDESMLLFLLQNHKALDNVFQFHFVSKLFSKLFEKGIQEAENYMISQYSRRGYQPLANLISNSVKTLN